MIGCTAKKAIVTDNSESKLSQQDKATTIVTDIDTTSSTKKEDKTEIDEVNISISTTYYNDTTGLPIRTETTTKTIGKTKKNIVEFTDNKGETLQTIDSTSVVRDETINNDIKVKTTSKPATWSWKMFFVVLGLVLLIAYKCYKP